MKLINLDWPLIAVALLPWGSLAAAALFTPRLTRPDLFFAVTVSPSFRQSPAGREILRRYDRCVLLVALLALFLVGFAGNGSQPLLLVGLLGPTMLELAGWFAAFIAARGQAKPYHVEPSLIREAALQPRDVSLPGGWLAQAGPFLVLAVIFLCLSLGWNTIPSRIPIHWGLNGKPDGWAAKSLASVFGCAGIGLLVCSFLSMFWCAVLRNVRRIHGDGVQALREARFLRVFSFFMLAIEYWLAVLMGLLSLAVLRSNLAAPLPGLWFILPVETLLIATIFFLAYRAGQGGWRWGASAERAAPDSAPVGDRTRDECWKLGLFYVNREDPALFVEKRFGIGWTINFGNPRALYVLAGFILFIAAIVSIGVLTTVKK